MTQSSANGSRRDLALFLRSRRERLTPNEVGLPPGPRRRTPGLRREEVAQLAGVGVTWYTWLEQGREIQVSTHFLENLTRALRLSPLERTHLFALAQHRPPPLVPSAPALVTPILRRLLASLPNPAYIKTSRWDVVAWNDAAAALFVDYAKLPEAERNLLWQCFTNPGHRQLIVDWPEIARRLLAKFRLDYAQAVGDPAFAELVERLRAASPEFRLWWEDQTLKICSESAKQFRHASLGLIELEHTSLAIEATPELRLIIYTPVAAEDAAKLRRLLSRRRDVAA